MLESFHWESVIRSSNVGRASGRPGVFYYGYIRRGLRRTQNSNCGFEIMRPWPICGILVGAFVMTPAGRAADASLSVRQAYCCDGGFSAENALAMARNLAIPDWAPVRLYQLSDRHEDMAPRFGVSERGVEDLVKDFLREAAVPRRVALYLRTPRGEAIDLWDGSRRSFERRVVSGDNPFLLPSGAEILYIVSLGVNSVRVYCRARAGGTGEVGRRLLDEAAPLFGARASVEVVWGDNPWLYGDWAFPAFVPALGWLGPPPMVVRPARFRCRRSAGSSGESCTGMVDAR
jgi:hypothetical protein